jgi:hypothetical protein
MGKKILISYYSRTGTTEKLSLMLKEALSGHDVDIERIIDSNLYSGIPGFVTAVFLSMARRSSRIIPPKKDPADYDDVVVMSPLWVGHISAPVRAYLNLYLKRIKNFSYICTAADISSDRTWKDLFTSFGCSPKNYLIVSKKAVLNSEVKNELDSFVGRLTQAE